MADRYHLLIAPDSTTSPRVPGPGRRVVSVPGVCGGDACLEGTRGAGVGSGVRPPLEQALGRVP